VKSLTLAALALALLLLFVEQRRTPRLRLKVGHSDAQERQHLAPLIAGQGDAVNNCVGCCCVGHDDIELSLVIVRLLNHAVFHKRGLQFAVPAFWAWVIAIRFYIL